MRAKLSPPAQPSSRPVAPTPPSPPSAPPNVKLIGTMTGDGMVRAVLQVGPRGTTEVLRPGDKLIGLPFYEVRSVSAGSVELAAGGRVIVLETPIVRQPFADSEP